MSLEPQLRGGHGQLVVSRQRTRPRKSNYASLRVLLLWNTLCAQNIKTQVLPAMPCTQHAVPPSSCTSSLVRYNTLVVLRGWASRRLLRTRQSNAPWICLHFRFRLDLAAHLTRRPISHQSKSRHPAAASPIRTIDPATPALPAFLLLLACC